MRDFTQTGEIPLSFSICLLIQRLAFIKILNAYLTVYVIVIAVAAEGV